MKLLALFLTLLLSISVAANFYLYSQLTIQNLAEPPDVSVLPKAPDIKRTQEAPQDPHIPMAVASFINEEYLIALEQWQSIADADSASQLMDTWYESLLASLTHPAPLEQQRFVQNYLKLSPYDPRFLYLEVEYAVGEVPVMQSIVDFIELLRTPMARDTAERIQKRVDQLLQKNIKQLVEIGSWDIVVTMLETLRSYMPDNQYYLGLLAEAYAHQRQFGLMDSTLAYLAPDHPHRGKIQQIYRQLTKPQRQPDDEVDDDRDDSPLLASGVPLKRLGEHFIAPGLLNENVPVNLMIDTGASTTVVSLKRFHSIPRRFKRERIGRFPINTAGGTVQAPIYRFKNLTIGNHRVENLAIVVMPLEGLEADGLLGMNFLRHFQFQIDQKRAQLRLGSVEDS